MHKKASHVTAQMNSAKRRRTLRNQFAQSVHTLTSRRSDPEQGSATRGSTFPLLLRFPVKLENKNGVVSLNGFHFSALVRFSDSILKVKIVLILKH